MQFVTRSPSTRPEQLSFTSDSLGGGRSSNRNMGADQMLTPLFRWIGLGRLRQRILGKVNSDFLPENLQEHLDALMA